MSPALEKAARAAADADAKLSNGPSLYANCPAVYDAIARAVLLAIREPDDKAVMAGAECVWDEPGRWSQTPPQSEQDEARNAFTAMIDAVLGEKPA